MSSWQTTILRRAMPSFGIRHYCPPAFCRAPAMKPLCHDHACRFPQGSRWLARIWPAFVHVGATGATAPPGFAVAHQKIAARQNAADDRRKAEAKGQQAAVVPLGLRPRHHRNALGSAFPMATGLHERALLGRFAASASTTSRGQLAVKPESLRRDARLGTAAGATVGMN